MCEVFGRCFGSVQRSDAALVFGAVGEWECDVECVVACIGEEGVFASELDLLVGGECGGVVVDDELHGVWWVVVYCRRVSVPM